MTTEEKETWWQRQITVQLERLWVIGIALAVVKSWERFHSVRFSMLAGFTSWFYVIAPSGLDGLMR